MDNMMKPVDLHTHSTCSDGTVTPSGLVQLAAQKGLSAFALTDHDTTKGLEEAMAASAGTDIEVIPGIELSTIYGEKDVHIVGLFFDYQSPEFKVAIQEFVDAREMRNRRMCEKMCAAGLPIPYDELMEANPGAVVTRANMAKFLLQKGAISNIKEAFDKYIGDDCPFFIPREKITPKKAVEFLQQYHGIPILAHPFQYQLGEEGLETLVQELKEAGLMGIEAYYSKHTPEMTAQIQALGEKYDLLLSGGSDFHGTNKPGLEMGNGYGHLHVPGECLVKMKHARYGVNDKTRIFFSDFDGTLANENKEVTEATKKALDRFVYGAGTDDSHEDSAAERNEEKVRGDADTSEQKENNIFVLSSGRAMSDVKAMAEKLGLHYPNQFLSGYNGAELYSCKEGTTFFRESLPISVACEVMELAREHGLYCQTYNDSEIVVYEKTKETEFYTSRVKMPVVCTDDIAGTLTKAPCKCLIIHLENQEDHAIEPFAELIKERYGDVLHTVMSNPWYLEIDPIRATKAYSLTWLCRHLGIDPANAIAAGDAQNDNPMLEAAGIGIGMCNGLASNPDMQKAADIITEYDNEHDGLARQLQELMDHNWKMQTV